MNSLTVFEYESNQVRVVMIDDEPWFCLSDALTAMQSSTTVTSAATQVIEGLGDEFVCNQAISDTIGRTQESAFVSESGLTFLLSRSRTEMVRSHVSRYNTSFPLVWGKLYQEVYYRYKIDLKTRAKNRGVKPIDVAEEAGMMEALYAIASEILV